MDIGDILEHNRQINVKRLEDKKVAKDIIVTLYQCPYVLFNWNDIQEQEINKIKEYINIYFNPELISENINTPESLLTWTKDTYLEIFENLDNRYILDGFEFYILNFNSIGHRENLCALASLRSVTNKTRAKVYRRAPKVEDNSSLILCTGKPITLK